MAKKRIDKDKIISAFLYCAAEKSAGAVSLSDIAAVLSVNKASLYNHFSSRDEIFEEAISFSAKYIAAIPFASEVATSATESFFEALEKTLLHYFREAMLDPLFQIYTFIHSCKFFSEKALVATKNEEAKIAEGVARLAQFYKASVQDGSGDTGNIGVQIDTGNAGVQGDTGVQVGGDVYFFAKITLAAIEKFICEKKSKIRKAPESGVGSLFSSNSEETENEVRSIVGDVMKFWKSK